MKEDLQKILKRIAMFVLVLIMCVFTNVLEAQAAGKYDESLYKDVLNYPSCYSGTIKYEKGTKTIDGPTVTLQDNVDLKYIIKDVTGDKIKELFVMDHSHLFIYTQKYNKKSKKMKLSLMTVLYTSGTELDVYYRKIKGKRYVGIDWKYTGAGTTGNTVFRVKGSKLSVQHKLGSYGPWQGDTNVSYTHNNKQITKKKYNSYIKKYFSKKYKVKYKVKNITKSAAQPTFYTMADKVKPSLVIIGSYAKKNVWTKEARTYMATYVKTVYDSRQEKVRLSDVKAEMKNLFGTNKTKFSKAYPYNTMEKKGKWVTRPYGDFGAEVPFGDLVNTYKIGNNVYRCRYVVYTQDVYNEYSMERLNLKTYYITFKKSTGKYGYSIKDIREIK